MLGHLGAFLQLPYSQFSSLLQPEEMTARNILSYLLKSVINIFVITTFVNISITRQAFT